MTSTIVPLTDPDHIPTTTGSTNESDWLTALYEDTVAFERIVGIIIPTLFAIVIFVGLIGNILVILVIVLNQQMQTSTNTLIINLAIADLLFILFCVPFTAADYALPIWVFSREWCKIMMYLQCVSAYASVWTLVLMSFDRFLAVVFPISSMTLRTVKKTITIALVLWAAILLLNLPNLWIHNIHQYIFIKEERSVCAFMRQATMNGTDTEVKAWFFTFNAFGYVIPLGLTCVLYIILLMRLWFGIRPAGHKSGEANRAKKKVTWMVTGVIVTFAVCWLPLNICFFLVGHEYKQGVQPKLTKEFFLVQVTSQVLAYSNSCLNPILYAFLSENFRKGFTHFFQRCIFFRSKGSASRDTGGTLEFERTQILRNSSRTPSSWSSSWNGKGTRKRGANRSLGKPPDVNCTMRLLEPTALPSSVDDMPKKSLVTDSSADADGNYVL